MAGFARFDGDVSGVGLVSPEFFEMGEFRHRLGEVDAEFFKADPFAFSGFPPSPTQQSRRFEGKHLVDHSRQNEHLQVLGVATAIERGAEPGRLFPGSENDLNRPAAAVKFAQFTRAHHPGRYVGDDDVPVATQQALLARFLAFLGGFFPGFATRFFGHLGLGFESDQAGAITCISELYGEVEDFAACGFEQVLKLDSGLGFDAEIGRDAAQPEGFFLINSPELGEAEIASVAQHEVVFLDEIDEVFPDFAVLLGGEVQLAGDGFAADEIDGEIDLEARRRAMAISVGGEVFVIAFGKFLLGRIFDENPPEKPVGAGFMGTVFVPLLAEREGQSVHHESHRARVGALPEGLFGEGKSFAELEIAGELAEGSLAGKDGLDEGEEVSCGGEFLGIALDEPACSCQGIEAGAE